jgi:uncharacterized zinc-type alcohol dehydrogenase-like protein
VLDRSTAKRGDALRLGADDYRVTTDAAALADLALGFDLIVSTVPANPDYDAYLNMLRLDGVFAGMLIGSIAETQEMLDFCAEHGISAEIETIGADQLDEAFDRVIAGDVQYRFVLDVSTLEGG